MVIELTLCEIVNEDTRATSLLRLWYLYCLNGTNFTYCHSPPLKLGGGASHFWNFDKEGGHEKLDHK